MSRLNVGVLGLTLVTGGLAFAADAPPRLAWVEACEGFRGDNFGGASVRTSATVEGGTFAVPGGAPIGKLPAFCRVILTASPVPASNITLEIWLPSPEVWNGKFLGTGNGGFGGNIRYDMLSAGAKRNYATANTDMGTYPAGIIQPRGYDAGVGHPEMVTDWGYRATHQMTVAAKALIARFYGHAANRSYFDGCSTGGHQGLSEAQRFPDDYDAIIAGAPGHNRTHLHGAFLHALQAALADGPLFSEEKLSLVRKSLVSACGGKDGGAPGDEFLTNPAICGFEPKALSCASGQAGSTCLSDLEVKNLEVAWDGVRNPRTHALIYPAWAKGGEASVLLSLQRRPGPKLPTADGVFRWVFGPKWDASKFDFDRDMATVDAKIGPTVNALSADLSAFRQHGGKLILYHGWADPTVSPFDSIVYFDRINGVGASSGDAIQTRPPSSFSRLFMVPGMGHCRGGEGPDSFGQNAAPDGPSSPDTDIVAALDRWVETGVAPEQILAKKLGRDGAVQAERPICSYPKVAKYNGTGDAKLAASFTCVNAPEGRVEFPAREYLK